MDRSQFTSKELDSLVEALGEEGIQIATDGTVKGIGDVFGDEDPKEN